MTQISGDAILHFPEYELDGLSLSGVLRNGEKSPHEILYHYCADRLMAVTKNNLKIHFYGKVCYLDGLDSVFVKIFSTMDGLILSWNKNRYCGSMTIAGTGIGHPDCMNAFFFAYIIYIAND